MREKRPKKKSKTNDKRASRAGGTHILKKGGVGMKWNLLFDSESLRRGEGKMTTRFVRKVCNKICVDIFFYCNTSPH